MRGQRGPALPGVPGAALRRGAFVTLLASETLRGCIGRVTADRLLGEVVRDMTVAAARDDPRFPPVAIDELAELRIAISVLGDLVRIAAPLVDPGRIVIGRDGLVVRRGRAVGLLLPQVAVEYEWDAVAFLAATCRKAGLAADAWRDPATEVLAFAADVFAE